MSTIHLTPHIRLEPVLDNCWSACNGLEGFGQCDKDAEMNAARKKHGENMSGLPCEPLLILYRPAKTSPLLAWFSYTRTFETEDDGLAIMARLCRALDRNKAIDATFVDWGVGSPRYSVDTVLMFDYQTMRTAKSLWKKFMKDWQP